MKRFGEGYCQYVGLADQMDLYFRKPIPPIIAQEKAGKATAGRSKQHLLRFQLPLCRAHCLEGSGFEPSQRRASFKTREQLVRHFCPQEAMAKKDGLCGSSSRPSFFSGTIKMLNTVIGRAGEQSTDIR